MEIDGRPEREDGNHRAGARGERHAVGEYEPEEGDGGGDADGQHRVLAGHRHRPVHLRAHVRRATGRQGEGAARGVRGTGGHVHQCHGGHRARGVLQGSAPVGGGRPGPSSVIDDYNRESTLVAAETKDDRLRLLDVQSGGPVRAPAR